MGLFPLSCSPIFVELAVNAGDRKWRGVTRRTLKIVVILSPSVTVRCRCPLSYTALEGCTPCNA